MTSWHRGPLLALDFETCGLPAWDTRVVQVALALIGGLERAVTHTWLVDPGMPIPEQATAVHHITDEMVQRDGRPYEDTLRQVADRVTAHLIEGHPLIAMNASFDCTLLEAELQRLGIPTITQRLGAFAPVIDPLVLDKRLDRRKGKRNLLALCEHYQVRHEGAHDAGEDALAAARVAWAIAERYPKVAETSPHELHAHQVGWAREQRDSLRAYFDAMSKAHDGVDPRWPVQLPVAAVPA